MTYRIFFALFVLFSAVVAAGAGNVRAQQAKIVRTENVTARLIAAASTVRPGDRIWIALHLKIRKGWHTYWRNPGDSGEATTLTWSLPSGYAAGPIQWTPPRRLPVGPLMNYGYEDEAVHPVRISVPKTAKAGETIVLSAKAVWLVCEKICIPEEGTLTLPLIVDPSVDLPDTTWGPVLRRALESLPKPAPWAGRYALADGRFTLRVAAPDLKAGSLTDVWFFPYDGRLVSHAAPQARRFDEDGLILSTKAADKQRPGDAAASVKGVLVLTERLADGKTVRHAFALEAKPGAPPEPAGTAIGLLAALGLAFLGGLLLNFMPCVFPILSLKVLSFVKTGADPPALRSNGIAYSAGVLASFLAIGAVLASLRLSGELAGWGYQLQRPEIVLLLFYVMVVVGLNLAGLFEFSGRFAGAGQSLAGKPGRAGAFFTGVLAVVVATPCTVPFMAPAVGYALAQPAPVSLAVMGALGAGMAVPFLLLSFWPALVRRLPRPGPWMVRFKQFMAFPMFATAAWLLWVLTLQAGDTALLVAMAGALLIAFGLWLWRAASGGTAELIARGLGTVALCAALVLAVLVRDAPPAPAASGRPVPSDAADWRPWTPERVERLRAEGRPVFVNFTAAWCITCLVNERTTLGSDGVKAVMKKHGVAYLKADWTKRDALIAKTLQSFGRSGVPLYVLYPPTGKGAPKVLPQILTQSLLIEHFSAYPARAATKPAK